MRSISRKVKPYLVINALCLALSLGLLSCGAGKASSGSAFLQKVDASKASSIMADNVSNAGFTVIDVRTQDEFASGHIAGSVNMDIHSGDFRERLDRLDRNGTYLVYCRTGNRSGQAMSLMMNMGFKRIYDLFGGVRDWSDSGYPLVK